MLVDSDGRALPVNQLLQALLDQKHIKEANECFINSEVQVVDRNRPCICVLQGEKAHVNYSRNNFVVGSDDATTCVIIVLLDPDTHTAWTTHYDQGTVHSDASVLDVLLGMQSPEAYLVGAYEEPSGVSKDVIESLLMLLHEHTDRKVKIRLACVASANTFPDGSPRTRALAVDCQSRMAYPAEFEDRGPEIPRRFAHGWCGCGPALVNIYTLDSDQLVLPAFDARQPSWYVMRYERLMALPDEEMVKHCSTSPAHEGPKFVRDMRAAYAWIIERQEDGDVPQVVYTWSSDRACWVKVHEGHVREQLGAALRVGTAESDAERKLNV
mmetsp:Transcript_12728/g.27572  ORF Transcript_12728/g.27572 Transcript_12728/m.27572 type:complete len:326 (+) Transcript_12728:73-1050(+)